MLIVIYALVALILLGLGFFVGYVAYRILRKFADRLNQITRLLQDIQADSLKSGFYSRLASLDTKFIPSIAADWSIKYDQANLVFDQLATLSWSTMMELGSGSSTVLWAHFLKGFPGRRIISLEAQPSSFDKTLSLLRTAEVPMPDLKHTPLVDHVIDDVKWRWYDISSLEKSTKIDVLFVDGPPGDLQPLSRYPALPLLRDYLSHNAVIILDDGARQDETIIANRWANEFGLIATYIPTQAGTWILRMKH